MNDEHRTSSTTGSVTGRDVSGRGMDRKIDRSKRRIFIAGALGVAVIGLAAVAWAMMPASVGSYTVKAARIQTAVAVEGQLDDFVSTLGTVAPAQTFYLDAVEGGRVEKVLALNGDQVEKGQPLLDLSNTQLQLDVLTRETEVSAQFNELRQKELDMERSRLSNARNLATAQTQRDTLARQVERNERLTREGAYPLAKLEDERAQLDMAEKILDIAEDQQATDQRLGKSQMQQMRLSTTRMQRNLDAARASLDALTVRAPVDGILTSFQPELGQSLGKGTRVGQIDTVDDLKLTVSIDEFYLERFQPGLPAAAEIGDEELKLTVGRVSAQVENGTFKADLLFDEGQQTPSLRRGQSFPVKVFLGNSTTALTLPNGPFMTATGGRWAFVLDQDGKSAQRRDIQLGRRNTSMVEVLNGLEPGERVVVSDYEGFASSRALQIKK